MNIAWTPESVGKAVVLVGAVLGALVYIGSTTVRGYRKAAEFVRRWDKALTAVEAQLYPNGGSSLRDAVNRIQEHLGIPNTPTTNDDGGTS